MQLNSANVLKYLFPPISVVLQGASDDCLPLLRLLRPLPLLPGGPGDHPLEAAGSVSLILQLCHGTQQLLPQLHQLILQLLHLLVLVADPVDQVHLLRVESDGELVDVLEVGDDAVPGDTVRFQITRQDVNFTGEIGDLTEKYYTGGSGSSLDY